jgi:hypothetical protein
VGLQTTPCLQVATIVRRPTWGLQTTGVTLMTTTTCSGQIVRKTSSSLIGIALSLSIAMVDATKATKISLSLLMGRNSTSGDTRT